MSSPFVMTTEIGLKSQIKKLGFKIENLNERITISDFVMLNMWRKLYDNDLFEEVDVWYYIKSIPQYLIWRGNSRLLGKKTWIAFHTFTRGPRKGKTINAHFTVNGFLEEAEKNDVPKFYTGYFPITEKYFEIDYKNLSDYDIKDIEKIFTPKKELRI